MSLKLHFLFLCEGSSDRGLVPHLERLCVLCGADEVTSVVPDLERLPEKIGRSVSSKVSKALELEPGANLIFIHRDADAINPQPRYLEIAREIESLDTEIVYVAVIPIQEMEAWLLLDETEIRRVADNPSGRVSLSLPSPKQVESIARPKERLNDVLIQASELSGRRLGQFRKSLPWRKQLLLERLNTEGAISQLSAWQQLEQDLRHALDRLRER